MKKIAILMIHALIGWGLCGAIIAVGRRLTTMENTLIIHAVGAPLIFVLLSLVYFKFFHFTSPLATALLFIAVVVFMDVFLVGLFLEKSFAMFASFLGTWLPFLLIFLATYFTGRIVKANPSS